MPTVLIALAAAFVASTLCLVIHLNGLRWLLMQVQYNRRDRTFRRPLLYVLLAIFTLHMAQVVVYAAVQAMLELAGLGRLEGAMTHGSGWFVDHLYFSLASYTTLGLGDIVPHGAIRLVAGVEALNGLLLVAWSATFTYLLMERLWSDHLPNGGED
jgi:hypothetical protein